MLFFQCELSVYPIMRVCCCVLKNELVSITQRGVHAIQVFVSCLMYVRGWGAYPTCVGMSVCVITELCVFGFSSPQVCWAGGKRRGGLGEVEMRRECRKCLCCRLGTLGGETSRGEKMCGGLAERWETTEKRRKRGRAEGGGGRHWKRGMTVNFRVFISACRAAQSDQLNLTENSSTLMSVSLQPH